MNVWVLTQEEPFYLPVFFERFFAGLPSNVTVAGVHISQPFNSQSGWVEVIRDHLGYYGPRAFVEQGLLFALYKAKDRLGGSGRFYSVRRCCEASGVRVAAAGAVNGAKFQSALKEASVDLLISVACPKILKAKTLATPALGAVNFHCAKLPKYRGMAPLFWAMLNGESETAVTIHQINEGIDDGDILDQTSIPILPGDTLNDLYNRAIEVGPARLNAVLQQLRDGTAQPRENDKATSSYFGFPDAKAGSAFREKGLKFR